MTYCNLFAQFNFGLGYLAGNCLTNFLGRTFFGGGWCTMPFTPMFTAPPMTLYNYYPSSNFNFFSSPNTQLMYSPPSLTYCNPPNYESDSDSNSNSIWTNNNFNFNYVPQFNITIPDFNNNYNLNNYSLNIADTFEHTHPPKKKKTKPKSNKTNNSNRYTPTGKKYLYSTLTKEEALARAKADPNLEDISLGGTGWSIATNCFRNDIPYAKTGTKELLDRVYKLTGIEFFVTSALGTKTSPHGFKDTGAYMSHYNHENPKLDLQPKNNPTSPEENRKFAEALEATGLFSRVYYDTIGGLHLDVQFDESAYPVLA